MDFITSILGGGLVAAVLLFIQFLITRHDGKEERENKILETLNDLKTDSDRREAVNARRSILRFGDELYNEISHSKEYFDQILEDVDEYEQYCKDHPEFKNSKSVMTIKHIRETYEKVFSEHKFL